MPTEHSLTKPVVKIIVNLLTRLSLQKATVTTSHRANFQSLLINIKSTVLIELNCQVIIRGRSIGHSNVL